MDEKQNRKKIGLQMRFLRNMLRLSQVELAKKLKIDRSFYGEIERGDRNYSIDKFFTVCKCLKIKPSILLRRAGF